ncbi:MAG: beta-ketoacyl synthase N-terminal-like domain-containing protein [Pseudomonadota bacterium]
MKAVVVGCDMITPYGAGTDACWGGILSGITAVSKLDRFGTAHFQSGIAATINGLTYHEEESLVMQMLRRLFASCCIEVPGDAGLVLSTTKGEIDILEMAMLSGRRAESDSKPSHLLERVSALAGVRDKGTIVSAACASSIAALARAAAMIRTGRHDCVLVIACDSVTEFVFAGFSSLMALSGSPARPFDRRRDGLSLGEAAAFALIMSESRARRERREILGEIAGWGLSDDANHMTGPSRQSEGLILAIKAALQSAGVDKDDIAFISAHGTGTAYNDAMEIRAFRHVFREGDTPAYSIKGGTGHMMGATGLVEMILALKALRENKVPPTVNMEEPDEDAAGWVSSSEVSIGNRSKAILTNAGFSGINGALVLAAR